MMSKRFCDALYRFHPSTKRVRASDGYTVTRLLLILLLLLACDKSLGMSACLHPLSPDEIVPDNLSVTNLGMRIEPAFSLQY